MVYSEWLSLRSFSFLLLSTTLVNASPVRPVADKVRRATPSFEKYVAFGDSFSAGVGAGSELGVLHSDDCHRYDKGYPFVLNALIYGKTMDPENLISCTGATAEQIKDQANQHMDGSIDLATVSLGGNNVNFGNIVNDCVYRFKGWFSGDCQKALQSSSDGINSGALANSVKDTLQVFLDKATHPNARIMVTGYAKFFNADTDQCDTVSWNYWQNNPENGSGAKMTKELRKQMNDLVDRVNGVLDKVVSDFRDARVEFVNYDDQFNNHRFCEDHFTEPQRHGEERLDLYMHQYETPDGQLKPSDTVASAPPGDDWAHGLAQFAQSAPSAKVAEPYNEDPVNPGDITAQRIPSFIVKTFHPTQQGHNAIAHAVYDALTHEGALQPPPTFTPLPGDKQATCSGSKVASNFPQYFVTYKGNKAAKDILYMMRDQVCQSKCGSIDGLPDNLLAHQQISDTGCEYAVKIAGDKELYFYATNSGQNCYDATQRMIDNCMTDSGDPINDASWINGPNYGEFYQVGVRGVNGDGSHHPALPTESDQHLGYVHVACSRNLNPFADGYSIYISNWDDGDWGKSILNEVKGCHLTPTAWKYYDDSSYTFKDGTKSSSKSTFNLVLSNGGCAESKIEKAMGLRGGGLNCPTNGGPEELDMFKQ